MNTSGEVADLMVKEAIQITEEAVKLSALGAKHLAALLLTALQTGSQAPGFTTVKRLIKSGEPLCILQMQEKDMKAFEKESKNYGILCAPIKGSDMETRDILVKQADAARLNHILEKLGIAAPEVVSPPAESTEKEPKNARPRAKENPSGNVSMKHGGTERTDSGTKPSVRKKIETIKAQQRKRGKSLDVPGLTKKRTEKVH